MGTNKALLPVHGLPLWRRQVALLQGAGAETVYVSVAGPVDWLPEEVPRLVDACAEVGPLGGILAALEQLACTHALVVAVDLPQLPSEWFVALREDCRAGVGAAGVWAQDGAIEPLAAIYPVEAVPLLRDAVVRHDFRLQPVLRALAQAGHLVLREIPAERAAWFANWNRPEDVSARSAH